MILFPILLLLLLLLIPTRPTEHRRNGLGVFKERLDIAAHAHRRKERTGPAL